MHLKHIGVLLKNADKLITHLRDLRILGIVRIHTDSGQQYALLLINLCCNCPCQTVYFVCVQRIAHFDMNRSIIDIRSIVVEDQIVRSPDLRK